MNDNLFEIIRRIQEVNSLIRQISMNVVKPRLPHCNRMEISVGEPSPLYEDELGDNNTWFALSMIQGYNGKGKEPILKAAVLIQVNLVENFDAIVLNKLPNRRYGKMAIVGISDAGSTRAMKVRAETLNVTLPDNLILGTYSVEKVPLRDLSFEPLFDGPASLEDLGRIGEAYNEACEEDR